MGSMGLISITWAPVLTDGLKPSKINGFVHELER